MESHGLRWGKRGQFIYKVAINLYITVCFRSRSERHLNKILDRYIFAELLPPFVISLGTLCFVMLTKALLRRASSVGRLWACSYQPQARPDPAGLIVSHVTTLVEDRQ